MEEQTRVELAHDKINCESPEYKKLIDVLRETSRIAERVKAHTPPALLNDRYFTTNDMLYHFRISRRALQNYRDRGIIPHITLGRVILYPESEVKKALEKNYYKPTVGKNPI